TGTDPFVPHSPRRLPMRPSPRPPLRVLVVDDCPEARVPLRLLLRLWGCDVAEAGDGPEALRQVEPFGPAGVLRDPGLPGLSGFEVAGRLRQDRPGLRLVLEAAHRPQLTGCSSPATVSWVTSAGVCRAKVPARSRADTTRTS